MPQYNEKVMEYFMNPRNVGEVPDANGKGTVGNPVCGDLMTFTIKVEDNRLKDVKFKTFGCGAAIAVSSIVTEMARGMTIEEAMKLTNKQVAEKLGGLPKNKLHCSNLGADALHRAIENYLSNKEGRKGVSGVSEKPVKDGEEAPKGCKCPYCETEVQKDVPFCVKCNREIK